MTPRTITLPESVHANHPDYTRARYGVSQAAAYLDLSRSVLYGLTKAGKLAVEERPNGFRYSQAALDAYAKTCRRAVVPAPLRAVGGTSRRWRF